MDSVQCAVRSRPQTRDGYELIVRQWLGIICKWKLWDLNEMGAWHLAACEGLGGRSTERGLTVAPWAFFRTDSDFRKLPTQDEC